MTGTPLTVEQRRRVERCQPLVDQLARTMARRLARIAEDELRSVGYEALVRCSQRYDPSLGGSFRTFAYHRVRGALIDASRRAVPGLRQRSRALKTLEATQALLEQVRKTETPDGPDPRTLEQRVSAAADLVAQTTAAVMLSSAQPRDPDAVAETGPSDLDTVLDDARMRQRVQGAITQCCDEQDRAIVHAIYGLGLSMGEASKELGLHKSTISRRHASMLRRLGTTLADSRG